MIAGRKLFAYAVASPTEIKSIFSYSFESKIPDVFFSI